MQTAKQEMEQESHIEIPTDFFIERIENYGRQYDGRNDLCWNDFSTKK